MAVRAVSAASGKMVLAIHQNTSAGAGYRKSLEGWARAGIKNVEEAKNLIGKTAQMDFCEQKSQVPGQAAPGLFGYRSGRHAARQAGGINGVELPAPHDVQALV